MPMIDTNPKSSCTPDLVLPARDLKRADCWHAASHSGLMLATGSAQQQRLSARTLRLTAWLASCSSRSLRHCRPRVALSSAWTPTQGVPSAPCLAALWTQRPARPVSCSLGQTSPVTRSSSPLRSTSRASHTTLSTSAAMVRGAWLCGGLQCCCCNSAAAAPAVHLQCVHATPRHAHARWTHIWRGVRVSLHVHLGQLCSDTCTVSLNHTLKAHVGMCLAALCVLACVCACLCQHV